MTRDATEGATSSLPGRERVGLMADAEQLFGRDVDLVTAPVGRTSLADRIGRDGVVLYDSGARRLRGRVRPVATATPDGAGTARERA